MKKHAHFNLAQIFQITKIHKILKEELKSTAIQSKMFIFIFKEVLLQKQKVATYHLCYLKEIRNFAW